MKELKCPNCGKTFTIDETSYESIVKQVRDDEFRKEIDERTEQFTKEKENEIKIAEAGIREKMQKQIADKDAQIAELKSKIELNDANKKLEITKALSEQDKKISELTNEIELNKKENEIKEKNLIESFNEKLKSKDEQIEYYKDFKARLSTKMLGESLEQHCSDEFNKIRSLFPHADFDKDNDAKTGSKGDYIFRDFDEDGNEIVSIMFEMKNEADETATKHKNEDFFKELDKDRKEKNCEYAVLVSMLEMDSDLYNNGIVDVSYKYDKMYVIRPQFFISLITLIRNLSMKSLEYKKELENMKNQEIDVTHFQERLDIFREDLGRNCRLFGEKFKKAIDEIDKTINNLQKTKEYLLSSEKQLMIANGKADDLTIKKLTKGNETMKKMFDEVEKEKAKEKQKEKGSQARKSKGQKNGKVEE